MKVKFISNIYLKAVIMNSVLFVLLTECSILQNEMLRGAILLSILKQNGGCMYSEGAVITSWRGMSECSS